MKKLKYLILTLILVVMICIVSNIYLSSEKELAKRLFDVDINSENVLQIKKNFSLFKGFDANFLLVMEMSKEEAYRKAEDLSDIKDRYTYDQLKIFAKNYFEIEEDQIEFIFSYGVPALSRLVPRTVKQTGEINVICTKEVDGKCKLYLYYLD